MTNWYRLDRSNVIVDAGGDWDVFAASNGGLAATKESVVGKELCSFVSGHSTRAFLDALFYNCARYSVSHSMLCRCDGPRTARLYRMRIMPNAGERGGLTVSHTLLSRSDQTDPKVVRFSDRYDGKRCSFCGAVNLAGVWRETWSVPDTEFFVRAYAICPKCRAAASFEADHQKVGHLRLK